MGLFDSIFGITQGKSPARKVTKTIPVAAHKRSGYKVKSHKRTIQANVTAPTKKVRAVAKPSTVAPDPDYPFLFVKEDNVSNVTINGVNIRLEIMRNANVWYEYVYFVYGRSYHTGIVTPSQLAGMIMAACRRDKIKTIVNLRGYPPYCDTGNPHWRTLVTDILLKKGYVVESSRGLRVIR